MRTIATSLAAALLLSTTGADAADLNAGQAKVKEVCQACHGMDGNSSAAGAVVDGTTLERAREMGLSAHLALEKFDSSSFFEKLSDAVITGPTGNNVRDLRMLLAW